MRAKVRSVTGSLGKIIPSLALAILLVAGNAFGWGGDGHKIVSEIADRHLTPEARSGVAELLGPGVSMADVSSWADQVRRERSETGPWHYINYALAADEPDFDVMTQPEGNVAWAVVEMTRRLQDETLDQSEREEALKFLIHFVGDLHQPMHCGTGRDAGGNSVKVLWQGRDSNLHRVWDGSIIQSRNQFRARIVEQIESKITAEGAASTQRGAPYDWMVESHKIARDVAYAFMGEYAEMTPEGPELSGAYADATWPIVERRLAEGGLRLAMILNHAFAAEIVETKAPAEELELQPAAAD